MTTTRRTNKAADKAGKSQQRAPGKWRSWETTEGIARAPHRSMMRAMGWDDEAINAPFVGIASTHNEVTPCNAGIKPLVDEIKSGVLASEGTAVRLPGTEVPVRRVPADVERPGPGLGEAAGALARAIHPEAFR